MVGSSTNPGEGFEGFSDFSDASSTDQAIIFLEKRLEQNPNDIHISRILAASMILQNDSDFDNCDAIELLQNVLDRDYVRKPVDGIDFSLIDEASFLRMQSVAYFQIYQHTGDQSELGRSLDMCTIAISKFEEAGNIKEANETRRKLFKVIIGPQARS